LKKGAIPEGIEKEEHFERCFVQPIVSGCLESKPSYKHLEIATHPWVKRDTPKPHSEPLKAKEKLWEECKRWANVNAWGLTHTLDIFVRDTSMRGVEDIEPPQDCIAIEVKFCKVNSGKPTGEFQRMIGQSLLFLGRKDHAAVIAVFGYRGNALFDPDSESDETKEMEEFLRVIGVWPVVLRVP
jgi:hypothetical protein